MKPILTKRFLICLSGIIVIMLIEIVGAELIFETTVTPNTVYEGTTTTFNLTVNNNVGGNENICAINVSMPLFSVTGTGSFGGWTITNGTDWFYLNRTSPGVGTGTIVTFVNIVQAKANLVTSDVNDTWNITVDNCDFNSTNSTTSNITILNDNISPTVSLVSPYNNNFTNTNNQNFTCNATDAESGLTNITFYWNYSGSWGADGTNSVSGPSNQTTFEKTSLNDGTYIWSCEACDQAGNCNLSAENRTITIDTVLPNINSYNLTVWGLQPTSADTVYISPQNSPGVRDGVRISLVASEPVVWKVGAQNSTNYYSIYSGTSYYQNRDVPLNCGYWNGTTSSCSGNYLIEGNYVLNVSITDQAGNGPVTDTSKTVIIDNTPPTINLLSPSNNSWSNTSGNNFTFNFIDNLSPIANCSLFVNGNLQTFNDAINGSSTTLSTTLTDGLNQWLIRCVDLAGNNGQSENWTINVDTVPPQIAFVPPTPASGSSQTAKTFVVNVSHNESNPAQLWVLLNGNIYLNQDYSGNYTNLTIGPLADGSYSYRVCINDSAGNQNCTEIRTISIYTSRGGGYSGSSYFYICQEKWNCSEWSECVNGTQVRNCTDLNNCNTEYYKPSTNRSCEMPKSTEQIGPVQICTPGERRCESGNVEVCSSDGTSWELAEVCVNGCESGKCLPRQEVSLTGLLIGREPLLISILAGLLIVIAAGLIHLWRKRPFRYRYPISRF